MDERGALLCEAPRGRSGFRAIDGDAAHIAMKQAHDLAVLQVDRWNNSESFEHALILGERTLGR